MGKKKINITKIK